ncbi:MAG: hypothetical protein PVJ57_10955 [Phycisphaerae bacterium]
MRALRVMLFLGSLFVLVATTGCATMTDSAAEVHQTYGRVWQYELLMMSDDWNFAWHMDRPTRLTRWQMR